VYGRSIIHEMYHYFGGHHLDGPGNGVADCHTPAECLDKGDWVCDTKLFHTIISGNDCSDITSRCPDGSTNVVDADNFMARTASCQYKFTEGQAKLLRFSISWASPFIVKDENLNIIAPIETEFYSSLPGDDKLITSPTLLSNPNYKTNGNLIIKKGGSLTIGANTTLRMGAGYKIVIEPGAYIRLEGKIKDQCGSPWSGIEVQGEKTINGLLSQGYFYSVSGAQIENAETALKLYGPLITDVGGKTNCWGLTIKNCKTGVDIQPYDAGISKSHTANFEQCTFITDGSYKFADPVFTHINMRSVSGVNIYGCSFNNTKAVSNATDRVQYGYGIKAIDGGFTLDKKCLITKPYPYTGCTNFIRSTFSGLGYGIYVGKDRGCKPYMILSSEFENCIYGAFLTNTSFGTILFNTFTLGQLPDPSFEQVGVMFESQTLNPVFEENRFIKGSGDANFFLGTIAQNMGLQDHVFRRNIYRGLHIANLVNGENGYASKSGGLTYNCTDNLDIRDMDFLMPMEGDIVGKEQGWPTVDDPFFKAAGNTFSHTSANNFSDFQNNGTSSSDPNDWRNYYYNPTASETPLYYFNIKIKSSYLNTCAQKYCEVSCPIGTNVLDKFFLNGGTELSTLKSAYANTLASYNSLISVGITAADARNTYYRMKLTEQCGDVIRYMLNDTLHNYLDSAAIWTMKLNTPAGDWYAADMYRNLGFNTSATSVVNGIGTRYSGFINPTLYSAQKNLFSIITSAQTGLVPASSVASYITGSSDYVTTLATAFQMSRGEYHPPHFWTDALNIRWSAEKEIYEPQISVYPNPTMGSCTIEWGPNLESSQISLYDVLGILLRTQPLSPDERSVRIDISNLPSGLYHIIVQQINGKKLHASVMVVK